MDANRNDLLGEIASEAALERTDFLVQATDQLRKFLDAEVREASAGVLHPQSNPHVLSSPEVHLIRTVFVYQHQSFIHALPPEVDFPTPSDQ